MKDKKQFLSSRKILKYRVKLYRIAYVILFIALLCLIFSCSNENSEAILNVTKNVGSLVQKTVKTKQGPIYVFEENHASLRGQIQIATMLTRLFKSEGLRIIGLEGAIKSDKPLPTASFISGTDKFARNDALRRMLLDGEISGVEYVGSRNPDVEVWGIESEEEYNVKPPEGISPGFIAILTIAEKIVSRKNLIKFNELVQQKKIDEALELLKDCDSWLRKQLEYMNKEKASIQNLKKYLQDILKKAEEVGVHLPPKVTQGIEQMLLFYETADNRSFTMVRTIADLSKKYPGEPIAMIIGAAHSETVMKALQSNGLYAFLLRPKNLKPDETDKGLTFFNNKSKGLWANDSKGTFGEFLNSDLKERKPPPLIGDITRIGRGSMHYAVSRVAYAARGGLVIPDDIIDELKNLPGGISVDPKSFSQDGFDVIFRLYIEESGKEKKSIWIRSGSVKAQIQEENSLTVTDSLEKDMDYLNAADNEPPQKPPDAGNSTNNTSNSNDPNKGNNKIQRAKNASNSVKAAPLIADTVSKYKAFKSYAEAKSFARISTQ